MKSLFITGTDTGVGKTFVAKSLITTWREAGLSVGVMKPCETGCRPSSEDERRLVPEDAVSLLRESGASLTLDEVCPYRFRHPLAPAEAAKIEGGDFSFDGTRDLFHRIRREYDVTLVEGAGGLLVPFEGTRTAADLSLALETPLLIVVRNGLGTINHTCMTAECALARGLRVIGVVLTRRDDPATLPPGPDEESNAAAIARLSGVEILGNIPFIPAHDHRAAHHHIESQRILAAL